MKCFSAALAHETSGFSPIQTDYASFTGGLFYDPDNGPPDPDLDGSLELGLRRAALRRGHQVVDSIHAAASPSAPPPAAVYERLRDRILRDLRRAGPVDAVLLFLHGAQMAKGYHDCEGDLLQRVRAIVGPDVPIGVELDLHCNMTDEMLSATALIATCLEYPHTDFAGRAEHVMNLVEGAAAGKVRPVAVFVPVPMLGVFHTTREPMREFVNRARALQAHDVLSVSIQHGFATADVPHAGAGVLVVADASRETAATSAERLARELFALRDAIKAPALSADAAIDEALAGPPGLVVIADASDNPGGGAAGDSTHLLRRLLERRVENAALGALWDPQACRLAMKAGVGARLALRIGGKAGPMSGDPLDLDITVTGAAEDVRGVAYGRAVHFGPHAAVAANGIDIVLSEQREQTHSTHCFTSLGIDLPRKRIVVVKSAQHFFSAFSPLASRIVYACPPGTVTTDYRAVPYQRLRRPIWPIDAPPFERDGRSWPA